MKFEVKLLLLKLTLQLYNYIINLEIKLVSEEYLVSVCLLNY